ncbi:hypothetical protein ADIWIN_3341 [Winogradskyella psychrotolerans RS-3]|uniref:Uncharacterized protein n=1 Tax=Winogradskyella psychrotolerans RS-3 TaxID=641526 RepID=S7WVE6_9FLAO|nr:hypothetical protein [Winogradskyella psychrotolerans]EPR70694.1 hypothetical protein ADIWIN_3341 [Winogradskyella psychrotolerans RS-3]
MTDEEREALGINKSETNKMINSALSGAASDVTAGAISNNSEVQYEIDKFIKAKKLPFELVSKWFNLNQFGQEDYLPMKLIQDRGIYSASAQEISEAETTTRGLNELQNSGKNLIKNTFVVFTKMNFVSNEPIALAIKQTTDAAANELSSLARDLALKGSEKIYNKTKEGYSVWTTAWLYRLDWTEKTWSELGEIIKAKRNGEDVTFASLDVNFEFIGTEKASSLVTFSLKEKRTEEQIIELSTIRNVDQVYAKLQKNHDVFKAKSPIVIEDGEIYSKIGMKEGLEGGENFEVLEEIWDSETNEITYKKIASIKVDKKQVWDNRYGASEGKEKELGKTLFKGKVKNLASGMLIRQIK